MPLNYWLNDESFKILALLNLNKNISKVPSLWQEWMSYWHFSDISYGLESYIFAIWLTLTDKFFGEQIAVLSLAVNCSANLRKPSAVSWSRCRSCRHVFKPWSRTTRSVHWLNRSIVQLWCPSRICAKPLTARTTQPGHPQRRPSPKRQANKDLTEEITL